MKQIAEPGAFGGLIKSLQHRSLSVGYETRFSLLVLVDILAYIFLQSTNINHKQNSNVNNQCRDCDSHSQNAMICNTNTNISCKTSDDNAVTAFLSSTSTDNCNCNVNVLDGFINALIKIVKYNVKCSPHCKTDADYNELNRQKTQSIAAIIDVIHGIKQNNFKIVADTYDVLVPVLINIVDDYDTLGHRQSIAAQILCEFTAYFSTSHQRNPNVNVHGGDCNCDCNLSNMMAVEKRLKRYTYKNDELKLSMDDDHSEFRPECKTKITRYLVEKGVIACICNMLLKTIPGINGLTFTKRCNSSKSKDTIHKKSDQTFVIKIGTVNYHYITKPLLMDMILALDTIMSFGEKYLKFVMYANGMECLQWFTYSPAELISNLAPRAKFVPITVDTNSIGAECRDLMDKIMIKIHKVDPILKQSLQIRLDQAKELDRVLMLNKTCKSYAPVKLPLYFRQYRIEN